MSRRKPGTRRSLKDLSPLWKLPIPSGQQSVGVQSVAQEDAQTLDWTFTASASVSSAAALAGDGFTTTIPQLQASGDGVHFSSPISVTALAGGGVRAVYSGPVLSPGSIFNITGTPTGVTFAAGTLPLPPTAFAYYNPEKKAWIAEAGEYTVSVGTSSRDLPLTAKITLPETIVIPEGPR